MSIKQTKSQSLIKTKHSNGSTQLASDRHTSKGNQTIQITSSNTQLRASNGILLKKSQKLIESSKQKRQVAPDKLKQMRHVFNTMNNSQPMPIERLSDALVALDYVPRSDIRYQDFLTEHELNETTSGALDFEHFALLVLAYEEKVRLEDDALHRLDLKIAFECFDINKDGMIDADELSVVMNILDLPITNLEAKEMIDFADLDKDSLLSFDEFLTVLTQISAMSTSSDLRQ